LKITKVSATTQSQRRPNPIRDALQLLDIMARSACYDKRQFRALFEQRAVDIVQSDLRRAGGLTECLEIGLLADAFNVPYASHGGGAHLHVLAALPNTLFMESGLLPEGAEQRLVDGCYLLPEEPGLVS
jgi:L-alanine-DL-glutamate epimerase-like enolase superfamily enzyme